jgi:SAM-dependent methyltransferase
MSLTNKINEQYSKRDSKSHLYHQSAYINFSQEEIKEVSEQLIRNYFSDLSDLKLLEIGAGSGHNALMFEKMGIQLKNISFNELLEDRIAVIKNSFPNNKLYAGDAITLNFEERYDIIFQSTVFTSILKDTDRKALANKMWELLKPGGIILWYDFIYNNPNNPDVKKVSVAEVKELFGAAKSWRVKKVTLAPPIGRKVGKFYKLFNLPFLRSHILAVFQKA